MQRGGWETRAPRGAGGAGRQPPQSLQRWGSASCRAPGGGRGPSSRFSPGRRSLCSCAAPQRASCASSRRMQRRIKPRPQAKRTSRPRSLQPGQDHHWYATPPTTQAEGSLLSCTQLLIFLCLLPLVLPGLPALSLCSRALPPAEGMVAGAAAGSAVEAALYPIDTIKTRLQVSPMLACQSIADLPDAGKQSVAVQYCTELHLETSGGPTPTGHDMCNASLPGRRQGQGSLTSMPCCDSSGRTLRRRDRLQRALLWGVGQLDWCHSVR